MSSARKVTIEFIGNDKSLGKTVSDVGGKTSKLSSGLQKAGSIAGKALAGGAILAAGGLYKMGQAAADDQQAQVKLATALKQSTGATDEKIAAVERWIEAEGKALGISDDELRPALSRLADATGDVAKAQDLSRLAMDISAGTGKDFGSVVEALIKAQNGSIGGLSRLGVATKKANGDTKSLKEVTADLAKTYEGRAAKAAETTAGKQKILQVQLSELGEAIGQRVLPVMLKLSEVGLKMVDWVSRNQTKVGLLVGALAALAAVTWAVGAAVKAWTAITKVWLAITKTATAVQWLLNAALTANPIGLVVAAIALLVVGLIVAYKKSETFRKIVNAAFNAVKRVAVAVFNKIVGAAQAVWGWINKNWPTLLAIITGPFGLAVRVISGNWDRIKSGVRAVKDYVVDKFRDMISFFRGMPGRISSAASGMWGGIKDAFKSAINWIIEKWNNLAFSMPSVDTHIPGVGTIGGWSLGTPNIPLLDTGGVVQGPGLVRVGPIREAMIPLSGPHARGMGGVTVNINGPVYGDPRAYAREILELLRREKRLTGGSLGLT